MRDQNKSIFLMENNIMVINWTNEWVETHWWKIPTYISNVIEDKMSDNKEFIYNLMKTENSQAIKHDHLCR